MVGLLLFLEFVSIQEEDISYHGPFEITFNIRMFPSEFKATYHTFSYMICVCCVQGFVIAYRANSCCQVRQTLPHKSCLIGENW